MNEEMQKETQESMVTKEGPEEEVAVEAENDQTFKRNYKNGFHKGMLCGILFTLALALALSSTMIFIMYQRGVLTVVNKSGLVSSIPSSASADAESNLLPEQISSLDELLTEEQKAKAIGIYEAVNKYYVGDMTTDLMADSIYHAIASGTGDEYTQYFSQEELDGFNNYTDNSYYGIGVTFYMEDDGRAYITNVYDDSPAMKAGVLAGDYITAVNGESIIGYESSAVSKKIIGEEGSEVYITIERENETLELAVERGNVIVDTVGHILVNEIAYVQVIKFGERTGEEFSKAIAEVKEEKAKAMIIDLRDNGGGRVDVVTKMMDEVLGEGVTLTMAGTDGQDVVYRSDEENKVDIPMVILVNSATASASEIFAAAIQDFGAGLIVGNTTFGKGVYQNIYNITNGGALKVTVGKFYTPKGNNFNHIGVIPDYEVNYELLDLDDGEYHFSYEGEAQMAKAFELAYELAGISPPLATASADAGIQE